jgi:hypothetical protein
MTIKMLLTFTLLATGCTSGDDARALPDAGEFTPESPTRGSDRPAGPEESAPVYPGRAGSGWRGDLVRQCDASNRACWTHHSTGPTPVLPK